MITLGLTVENTGTGKSGIVRAIAKFVGDGDKALVRWRASDTGDVQELWVSIDQLKIISPLNSAEATDLLSAELP